MTQLERPEDEISLFGLATLLLNNRWRVVRWALGFGFLAALTVIANPKLYRASASFVPQGVDPNRTGLSSLATQLGVSIPSSSNATSSPDFYVVLLKSRVILRKLAHDTLAVSERANRRASFYDLFEIDGNSEDQRDEEAVKKLRGLVDVSVDKLTNVVEVDVKTEWRSVSLQLASRLIQLVNEYNQEMRQSQAAAERRFVEGRLTVAGNDLRAAEDRLRDFQQTNRQIGSPQLQLQAERLQRDIQMQQQVYTSLKQGYEDARIREVRDTPVISVLEPASVPTKPEPRGRVRTAALGMALGAFLSVLLILAQDALARRRIDGDTEAVQFVDTLHRAKAQITSPLRGFRARAGRG